MPPTAHLESKYFGQTVLDDLHITPIHAVKAILVVRGLSEPFVAYI